MRNATTSDWVQVHPKLSLIILQTIRNDALRLSIESYQKMSAILGRGAIHAQNHQALRY